MEWERQKNERSVGRRSVASLQSLARTILELVRRGYSRSYCHPTMWCPDGEENILFGAYAVREMGPLKEEKSSGKISVWSTIDQVVGLGTPFIVQNVCHKCRAHQRFSEETGQSA